MSVSFEEASKCPKCERAMVEVASQNIMKGGVIKTLECQNNLCLWFEERKLVQIDKDGNIPVRGQGEKDFTPYTPSQQAALQQRLEHSAEVLRRGRLN